MSSLNENDNNWLGGEQCESTIALGDIGNDSEIVTDTNFHPNQIIKIMNDQSMCVSKYPSEIESDDERENKLKGAQNSYYVNKKKLGANTETRDKSETIMSETDPLKQIDNSSTIVNCVYTPRTNAEFTSGQMYESTFSMKKEFLNPKIVMETRPNKPLVVTTLPKPSKVEEIPDQKAEPDYCQCQIF